MHTNPAPPKYPRCGALFRPHPISTETMAQHVIPPRYLASPRSLGWRKLLAFFDVSAYPTTSSLAGAGATASSLSTPAAAAAASGSTSTSAPTHPPDTIAAGQGTPAARQSGTDGAREGRAIEAEARRAAARSGMRGGERGRSPKPRERRGAGTGGVCGKGGARRRVEREERREERGREVGRLRICRRRTGATLPLGPLEPRLRFRPRALLRFYCKNRIELVFQEVLYYFLRPYQL